MWDRLTRTDLERVRSELQRSRAELLNRQAAELAGLDAEWLEVLRYWAPTGSGYL